MSRYKVTDNKTGKIFHYSRVQWNLAWGIVFLSGIILGIFI